VEQQLEEGTAVLDVVDGPQPSPQGAGVRFRVPREKLINSVRARAAGARADSFR
jgi:hypothetical protein